MSYNLRPRPLVVYIDDNPDDRMIAQRAINNHELKLDFLQLSDGLEAIDALTARDSKRPDIIFIDNKMPVLQGTGLIRTLNEHEPLHDVPMILVSSQLTEKDIREAYKAGARSCVRKGDDPLEWNRQMRSVLVYWLEINAIVKDPVYPSEHLGVVFE